MAEQRGDPRGSRGAGGRVPAREAGGDPGGLVGVFWARESPGFRDTDDQIHPSCSMDSGETRDLEA